MKSSAIISECGLYRYRLERIWDEAKPPCVWVMLNPSTADTTQDDPTIRKCIGFARRFGCGSIVVVNLFALRSTDPKAMRRHPAPVGPDNDRHIREAAGTPGAVVIAAWGAHGDHQGRDAEVMRLLHAVGVHPNVIGRTVGNMPRHPLMAPYPKGPTP